MLSTVVAILASAYPTCMITVANDRPSTPEIYWHEVAHCNGWDHPAQGHQGKPRRGYRAPKPPAEFVRDYRGTLIVRWVSTDEALAICGSYGCAVGGLD